MRLAVLIYINLFPDPQTMAQMIDRLSPLMVMTYPIACMIGYLRAPAVYARQSMQRRAKKLPCARRRRRAWWTSCLAAVATCITASAWGRKSTRRRSSSDAPG
ncbi:MAG: hypothetical protein ACLTV6_09685 [Christensenellales bacterium]